MYKWGNKKNEAMLYKIDEYRIQDVPFYKLVQNT